MTTTTRMPAAQSSQPLARTAAVTAAAALAANMALFGLARARGVNFQFPQPGSATGIQTVGIAQVVLVTLLAMTAGWAGVRLADRRQRPILRTIAIIGGGLAVVSTVAPLSLDAGWSVKFTLASLHVITGAFYMAGVAWLHRANTGETQ